MSDELMIETEDGATIEVTPAREGIVNLIVIIPGEPECEVRVNHAELAGIVHKARGF